MRNDLYPELRRHNLLRTLLQHRIVAKAVADESVEPETLEEARKLFMAQRGLKSEEAITGFLIENGLTQQDLEWQIALPTRVQAHCEAHYRHKAEARFLSRKNQLDKVVYSLLRLKDPCLAQELYLRIEAKEASFTDLAAQYSEGAEQKTRGIIGPVSLTQSHPLLAEKLRTAQEGVLLQPFHIGEWILVVRLESYTPACFDENTAQKLSEELFNQWVFEETSRILREFSNQGVKLITE